jgi:small subunit ribosomal protein S9
MTEEPEQPQDDEPTQPPAEEGAEPTAAPDEPPVTDSAEDAPAEEPAAEAAPEEPPAEEAPAEEAPAEEAPAEEPVAEEPAAEEPAAEEAPAEEPAAEAAPAAEQPERRPRRSKEDAPAEPEVIPGAHLEPDLVLEQPAAEADEYAQYAEPPGDDDTPAEATPAEPVPAARTPLELAADARYQATGKRKTAKARVILKPGTGTYVVNGKPLDVYFPRLRLQSQARQPLETTGNASRMDVQARIHGGGVAAQAEALRHGIARALVDAEPTLRIELKRQGFLTRDPRKIERKKAGLKKARKRPQFSKR